MTFPHPPSSLAPSASGNTGCGPAPQQSSSRVAKLQRVGGGVSVRERPIIFSGEMVRALLDGRKTQTRRVVRCACNAWHINKLLGDWSLSESPHQVTEDDLKDGLWRWRGKARAKVGDWIECAQTDVDDHCTLPVRCPYKVGERRWVKETFRLWDYSLTEIGVEYMAGGEDFVYRLPIGVNKPMDLYRKRLDGVKVLRPSIFMPRWASRITLEIVSVGVERVQEITEDDAIAEGIVEKDIPLWTPDEFYKTRPLAARFASLWMMINNKRGFGWDKNPWIWRVEFRRVKP